MGACYVCKVVLRFIGGGSLPKPLLINIAAVGGHKVEMWIRFQSLNKTLGGAQNQVRLIFAFRCGCACRKLHGSTLFPQSHLGSFDSCGRGWCRFNEDRSSTDVAWYCSTCVLRGQHIARSRKARFLRIWLVPCLQSYTRPVNHLHCC